MKTEKQSLFSYKEKEHGFANLVQRGISSFLPAVFWVTFLPLGFLLEQVFLLFWLHTLFPNLSVLFGSWTTLLSCSVFLLLLLQGQLMAASGMRLCSPPNLEDLLPSVCVFHFLCCCVNELYSLRISVCFLVSYTTKSSAPTPVPDVY